jgi:hypothetical protein
MDAKKRTTTFVKRDKVSRTTQVKVWARAAGRCVLCAKSVLDGRSFFHTVLTGQMAHNVGATPEDGSPRNESDLTLKERSLESNLLLLCHPCHTMIDDKVNTGLYTQALLTAKKHEHELRVAKATNFEVLRRTLVVATKSRIRGTRSSVADREIAEAMVAGGLVVHVNDGRPVHIVVNLDDDEDEGWVWERGMKQIREAIAQLKYESEEGKVDHVSIFPLAPIPLLVYLGSALDDKLTVSLFDRHRGGSQNVWCWPVQTDACPEFEVTTRNLAGVEEDVVALISLSGSISENDIPSELNNFPVVTLTPVGIDPRAGLIDSETALESFSTGWLQLLAKTEKLWPAAKRLHLLAAVPASAAVRMGQYRMRGVHPSLVVYQRTDAGKYVSTPEIGD